MCTMETVCTLHTANVNTLRVKINVFAKYIIINGKRQLIIIYVLN